MASVSELLQEYGETEAGKALAAKGFTATHAGGAVVFRAECMGVAVDVLDMGTDMAPRLLTDDVLVHFSTGGKSEDAFTLYFSSVAAFIASLK